MIRRFRQAFDTYPRQFWYMVGGNLISATGGGLIWPFLTLYLRQRLDVPISSITTLFTLNAVMGILSSFIAGPAADRIGRKPIMLASLFAGLIYYIGMSGAGTLAQCALLMAFWGAFSPLYSVGANAMIADIIPDEQRTEAYSLLRIVQNVGVALGPVLGGYIAAVSMNGAFYMAAGAFGLFGTLVLLLVKETLPASHRETAPQGVEQPGGLTLILRDMLRMLRDWPFLSIVAGFTITHMATSIMFTLLPVYVKENFNLPQSESGYIIMVNAAMCIFVQYTVTRLIRHYRPIPLLAIGAMFYAVGVGSVALGRGFWAFALSMAVMTIGELIMTPTATTLVANMAPADMRGRYMSLYVLAWPISSGTGPVIAGKLNDRYAPQAMWYGGFVFGLIGALSYVVIELLTRNRKTTAFASMDGKPLARG